MALVVCFAIFASNKVLYAQTCTTAPNISYSGVNSLYVGSSNIAAPTNAGGSPVAFGVSASNSGTGFNNPYGVAVDAAGALYVVDHGNNSIKKIVGNTVTVICFAISNPIDVAVDNSGGVYVTDGTTNSIVKVVNSSTVTTIASGFYSPRGIAIDASGAIYVADFGNSAVKKIVGNVITTLGSGFSYPQDVAVDALGNVYVADYNNGAVKKIVGNTVSTIHSSAGYYPNSIDLDALGNVYVQEATVTSPLSYRLQKIVGNTVVSTISTLPLYYIAYDPLSNKIYGSAGNDIKNISLGNFAISPALPAGLNFNTTTGAITGLPTATTANTTYTINTQNTCGGNNTTIQFATRCQAASTSFSVTTCGSYTWAAKNNAVYTSNTTDTVHLITAGGCDSLVTMNLDASTPNISYNANSIYNIGSAISLSPTNTGSQVLPVATQASTTNIGSNVQKPFFIEVDNTSGDIYIQKSYNGSYLQKVSGNTITTIYTLGLYINSGIAVDEANGAVYFADNGAIKKAVGLTVTSVFTSLNANALSIDKSTGILYILANTGTVYKIVGGTPVATSITGLPSGTYSFFVANNVAYYATQTNNSNITKYDFNTSTASTIASGSGQYGINTLVVDNVGTIYYSDAQTLAVKRISQGTTTTIRSAGLDQTSLAIDASNNLYIATQTFGANVIQKLTFPSYSISPALPTGLSLNATTGIISGSTSGPVANATYGITTQSNCGSSTANITFAIISAPTFGTHTVAACDSYTWVEKQNTVYTASNNTDTIHLINYTGGDSIVTLNLTITKIPHISYAGVSSSYTVGTTISTLTPNNTGGTPAAGSANTSIGSGWGGPFSVAVDNSGVVYVSDYLNGISKVVGSTVTNLSSTQVTLGVAVNNAGSVVYYTIDGDTAIQKLSGGTVTTIGSNIGLSPVLLAVDASGAVYTANPTNGTVFKIAGGTSTLIASGFNLPYGVAVDASGAVYVAEYGNGAIKKIVGSTITTIGSGISNPIGLAVDASGAVYVTDNGLIKKIVGNTTTTIATGFYGLVGVAVDLAGNIYATQSGFGGGTPDVFKITSTPPYAISPALPAGLNFNTSSGVITGKPTAVTSLTDYFIYTANSCGNDTAKISFETVASTCVATSSTFITSSCGSYTWAAKGNKVYTTSNYTDTVMLVNAAGCDSVITLNLTINIALPRTSTQTACNSYTWNGTTYTTSGTKIFTFTNASGCPTSDTLFLTINTATHNSTTQAACNSYTWNGTTYTTSGNKLYSYTNANGCASVDTLKLTLSFKPNISYINVSNAYTLGTAITPINVTNTGGLPPASSTSLINIDSNLGYLGGLSFDAAGNLYVAASDSQVIYKYSGSNRVAINSAYGYPLDVAVAADSVYFTDDNNQPISKVVNGNRSDLNNSLYPYGIVADATGTIFYSIWNATTLKKIKNGVESNFGSGLSNPNGLAMDAAGNIYVANTSANAGNVGSVKKITSSGVTTTLASGLVGIVGVAVDAAGNIYAAISSTSNSIKKIDVNGNVSTYASGINGPSDVAVDANGTVYYTEADNGSVVKIVKTIPYTISPMLPTGLSFNSSTASITGTPTVATPNTIYTIITGNSCGNDTTTISFATIVSACIPTSSTHTVSGCGSYTWAAKGNKLYSASNNTDTVKLVNTAGCDSVVTLNLTIYNPTSDTSATVCNQFTWHGVKYYNTGDKKFTLTGAGAGGCDSVITLHLTIKTLPNTFRKTDAGCYGSATGSIIIAPTGGVGPFTYRIGTVGPIAATSGTFNSLKAGTYRAYVQDATGCIGVAAPIVIAQSGKITATVTPSPVTGCYGNSNGSLVITNPVGVAPFQYKVFTSGTYAPFTTPFTVTSLTAGKYGVYIKDANGCEGPANVVSVTQPGKVSATFTKVNETCPSAKDGSITAKGTGGISPFQYKLNTTGTYGTGNSFTGLSAGIYKVYAKDANGCEGVSSVIDINDISNTCPPLNPLARLAPKAINGEALTISLSPNPTTNQFTLTAHNSNTQSVSIRVLDAVGKMVYATTGNAAQPFRFGNSFANGLYMIEVKQGEEVKMIKAVKGR